MKVGVPTEIKTDEYRVALTPAGVRELREHGHEVVIQSGAGVGSAIEDGDYTAQGARILPDAEAVFGEADMIVKVKEPQPPEVALLEPRHTLFTYLHLAPDPELTRGLVESGATCVAYETVEDDKGRLPLLAPMSEVAGKIATQAGAFMLEKPLGGRGLLLGGVPGVAAGKVLVIGGGVVGMNAAIIALGMQAETYVFDRNIDRLRELESMLNWRASTVYASTLAIEEHLRDADLVIGAVLVHGARAPHVVTREQLGLMKKNAVLVDVSIDQGGCFETSRPTTHSDPTYEVDGITHYCVANMPGAVPITSTYALTNATMPYVLDLADVGVAAAAQANPGLVPGVNVVGRQGHLRPGRGGHRARVHAAVRRRGGGGCSLSRVRLAATVPRRMPTTSQLVRKGRKAPKKKLATPGLKSGQGPQEARRRPAAARRLHACLHDDAEEAELRAAQGRPCPPDQRDGGHGLHPGRGPQPAGALRRARARRPRQGPPGRALQGRPRDARRRRRLGPQEGPLPVRREGQVVPRRAAATIRPIEPDAIHRSKLVQQVINKVMLDGKKSTAERIVYDALAILSERTGKDPVEALELSIKALTPVLEVRSRRVGGATYQVPVEVPHAPRPHARRALARGLRPRPPRALDGAAPRQRAARRAVSSRAAPTSARTTSSAWRRPTRPSRTTAGSPRVPPAPRTSTASA